MSGISSCSSGRGVTGYHKLPEARRRKGKSSAPPSRVWVFAIVRRAVVKAVGLYVRRKRWVLRRVRRVTWLAVWAKVRRTVGLAAHHAGTASSYYDSESYARNFDDGTWKEKEEEYWRSGSFAYRFGPTGRFGKYADRERAQTEMK